MCLHLQEGPKAVKLWETVARRWQAWAGGAEANREARVAWQSRRFAGWQVYGRTVPMATQLSVLRCPEKR